MLCNIISWQVLQEWISVANVMSSIYCNFSIKPDSIKANYCKIWCQNRLKNDGSLSLFGSQLWWKSRYIMPWCDLDDHLWWHPCVSLPFQMQEILGAKVQVMEEFLHLLIIILCEYCLTWIFIVVHEYPLWLFWDKKCLCC